MCDPRKSQKPVEADQAMRDPLTDLSTQPAREGQGANRPRPEHDDQGENEEDAGPLEEGFSPVP
jgi:hypothetical protein